MKISWANLHYFVLIAIVLNFALLYALSANQLSKDSLNSNTGSLLPSSIQLLKSNNTEIDSTTTSSHSYDKGTATNRTDKSVAEDIGKTMSSGTKPFPIPVTTAIKTLIEVSKEEAEEFNSNDKGIKASSRTMMYLIIIIVIFAITLFFYESFIKRKERNSIILLDSNNPNDKYILLDAEEETEAN